MIRRAESAALFAAFRGSSVGDALQRFVGICQASLRWVSPRVIQFAGAGGAERRLSRSATKEVSGMPTLSVENYNAQAHYRRRRCCLPSDRRLGSQCRLDRHHLRMGVLVLLLLLLLPLPLLLLLLLLLLQLLLRHLRRALVLLT